MTEKSRPIEEDTQADGVSQADSVFPIFWILPHPIKWQNWFCYISWLITNQNLTVNRLCIHLRVFVIGKNNDCTDFDPQATVTSSLYTCMN